MIRLTDLASQHAALRSEIDAAIADVVGDSAFVLGAHVEAFERSFAAYCGADAGIGVSSGTSALHLALLAAGVRRGDEVITSAFTFVATVAAIAYIGARPRLVDIAPDSFTIDPRLVEAAVTPRTRAVVPVHLYGQAADMDPILAIARRRGLAVVEDACQAHGATYRGRRVGSLGDAGCFSFYPSKNLGACGEGGMIVTSQSDLETSLRLLRNWGQPPGQVVLPGFSCRLHGMQAAILGVKLPHLEAWNARRRAHAALYDDAVVDSAAVRAPCAMPYGTHVYHVYALRCRHRTEVEDMLRSSGIETRVHYPAPIHLTPPWTSLGYGDGDLPEAERASREVLSIPVHPNLSTDQVKAIADTLRELGSDRPAARRRNAVS